MLATVGQDDIDRLCDRAAQFIASGRLAAARPLMNAIRRLAAPSARIAELSAVLAIQEGELDAARAELDAGIAAWPEHPGLYVQRAGLSRLEGDAAAAAGDAAQAVLLAPGHAHAKALLGTALLDLGRASDACACLAESLAAQPDNTLFRLALSTAQTAGGDPAAARATLREGLERAPGDIACRRTSMLIALQNGEYAEAVALAEAATALGIADALIAGMAGHALSKLGRHQEAASRYAEARELGPDDPYVRHLVAVSGAIPEQGAAPADYVRAVFDGYAPIFDTHLLGLGYRVPGLIRAALLRHSPLARGEPLGPVLDLGCGTGLVAVALLDLPVRPLHGVDLSARMLEQAAAKRLYASLHQADALAHLEADQATYAAILAADMFCYLGDLDPLLAAMRARLAPGGLCVFSAETGPPGEAPRSGWGLGRQGRYHHSPAYIRAAAARAGFAVLELTPEEQRQDFGVPVPGLLAVLRAG
ncbi:MAG TPA: methyltransferase domain-containing protein [Acetobacteraceae bacterium]|nr:methyltransferase domain-containing protein [Acetobacteraceae bacterium]